MNEAIKAINKRVREQLLQYDSRFIAIINNNAVRILDERTKEAQKRGEYP